VSDRPLTQEFDEIARLLADRPSCILTTHVHPEGDALGSQLALAHYLRARGIPFTIINPDAVPRIYRFMDPAGWIQPFDAARHADVIRSADLALVTDVASRSRIGPIGDLLSTGSLSVVCIDHHAGHDGMGDVNVVDPQAAATCEIIYDFLCHLGAEITPTMAEEIFIGIATDTGWFRFANTQVRSLMTAAETIKLGAKPPELYERIYENLSWERMTLLSLVLATLRSEGDGKIGWAQITRDMFEQSGATEEDTEGIIDVIRGISGTEVLLLFRETRDGHVKVNLRSKHDVDVRALAARFDGGGHRRASGITSDQPLAVVVEEVLAAAKEMLS